MNQSGKQSPNGEKLANELYDIFHSRKEFSGYDINVTSHDGHVNLQGMVDVAEDVNKATQFVKNYPGVKSVETDLTISTDGAITDDDIYVEMDQEMSGNSSIDPENIKFTVKNGVVTLLGKTLSAEERDTAEHTAKQALGVRTVNNQIKIKGKDIKLEDIRLW